MIPPKFGWGFFYVGPDPDHALERLRQFHPLIAVDVETIGLKGDKSTVVEDVDEDGNTITSKAKFDASTTIGFGICTSISPPEAYYFPTGFDVGWPNVPMCSSEVFDTAMGKVRDPLVKKVYWNANFDIPRIFENYGVSAEPFEDTMLAYKVQGLPGALDKCSLMFLGDEHAAIEDVLPARKTMLDLPVDVTAQKCIRDVIDTMKLHMMARVEEWRGEALTWYDWLNRAYDVPASLQDCYHVDRECVRLIQVQSKMPIPLDEPVVTAHEKRLSKELSAYERLFQQHGINPGSPEQVGWLMARRGHWLPHTGGKKPKMKADEEQMLRIAQEDGDPLAFGVLSYRRRRKLKGTYIDPIVGKPYMNTHYRIDLASGRFASSNRSVHQHPPSMRDVFLGPWTWFDFSQIEMRIFAHKSRDPIMLSTYEDYDRGIGDGIHVATLNGMFPGEPKKLPSGLDNPLYTTSKSFNFLMIYYGQAAVASKTTGRPIDVCQDFIDKWLYYYHDAHMYMLEQMELWWDSPWVPTEFGRRCRLPDNPFTATPEHIKKCILNYPIQGTGADILKRVMLKLEKGGTVVPIHLHDECVNPGLEWFPGEPLQRKGLWGGELATIHPELLTPFEQHQGVKWQ